MSKQVVSRPSVGDLSFCAYDWAVHPELVASVVSWRCERDGYQLRVDLTSAGHVVNWRWGDLTLVEILCEQSNPLPTNRQLFAHRIGGERTELLTPYERVTYHVCFQNERLPEELFWRHHDELRRDGESNGVFHVLQPNDRLGLSPLSYMDLQARKNSLLIHSYHTYPDELSVVKVQTLIEIAP